MKELSESVVTLQKDKIRLEKALDDQKQGAGRDLRMEEAQKEIKDLRRRIKTAEQEIEALQHRLRRLRRKALGGTTGGERAR